MPSHDPVKDLIVHCCHLMAQKGLIAGTEGNVSARARDGGVWTTPSDLNKGQVTADALVRIDFDGNILEGDRRPTSERFMHLEFYKQRPGSTASRTAIRSSRRPMPPRAASCPRTSCPNWSQPSAMSRWCPMAAPPVPSWPGNRALCHPSQRLPAAEPRFDRLGATVSEAYQRLEVVEAYSKTCWAAEALGGVKPMTAADIADLPEPSFA